MESVIATISHFGTRQTGSGEVFTMHADGVEYSTFKRHIWESATPHAGQLARINFSSVLKNGRQYRNLEGVESANGAGSPMPPGTGSPGWGTVGISGIGDVPVTVTDYARPKHPDDKHDIMRCVALEQAVRTLPNLQPAPNTPTEIITIAEYFVEWLNR